MPSFRPLRTEMYVVFAFLESCSDSTSDRGGRLFPKWKTIAVHSNAIMNNGCTGHVCKQPCPTYTTTVRLTFVDYRPLLCPLLSSYIMTNVSFNPQPPVKTTYDIITPPDKCHDKHNRKFWNHCQTVRPNLKPGHGTRRCHQRKSCGADEGRHLPQPVSTPQGLYVGESFDPRLLQRDRQSFAR